MKDLSFSKETLDCLFDIIDSASDVVKFQLRDTNNNHHLWYNAHVRLKSSYERYLHYFYDDFKGT